jgi:hypothetical protein
MAHHYILGQSGTGKSTYLRQLMIDRIRNGDGLCYFDPHGSDTLALLPYIPKHRVQDVVIFDPSREEVIGWNPLQSDNIPRDAALLIDAIKDAWGYGDMPTPVLDMFLYFSLTALMEAGETMIGLPYLLNHAGYRSKIIDKVEDQVVKDFWAAFSRLTPKEQREQVSSTLNKALMLIADLRVRRMLSLKRPAFSVGEVVRSNQILLVRLPQGELSIGRVRILGSVLLSQLHQAALTRTNETMLPFHFFLDECHHWAPSVVKEMLSGIRKFNCTVTLAHQYIDQLAPDYYAAITGNAAHMTIFRTSVDDADRLERRFGPNQMSIAFDQLENFTAREYPFKASTPNIYVAPVKQDAYQSRVDAILSRHTLEVAYSRETTDRALRDFMKGINSEG